MSAHEKPAMFEKTSTLPNAEEYLSAEQRWEAVAELLANMVLRSIDSEREL